MSHRAIWRVLLCVSALSAAGCYTVKYDTKQPPGGRVFEERENYFCCGLVGDNTIDFRLVCPDGVARWYNQATFVDGLLSCVTLSIYTPRTVHVECRSGHAYEFKQDFDTGRMCAVRLPDAKKEVAQ